MSLILNFIIVKECKSSFIAEAIAEYTKKTNGIFEKKLTLPDKYGLLIDQQKKNIFIFFTEYGQYDFEDIAKYISKKTQTVCMELGIYEGDSWHYNLYVNGNLKDNYGTHPTTCLRKGEKPKKYFGNPQILKDYWPEVNPNKIKKYLINHESFLNKRKVNTKAFPDDEFERWDGWNVCDFIKKLSFDYPDVEKQKDSFTYYYFENDFTHKNIKN